jgi:hypothetical protein
MYGPALGYVENECSNLLIIQMNFCFRGETSHFYCQHVLFEADFGVLACRADLKEARSSRLWRPVVDQSWTSQKISSYLVRRPLMLR